MHWGLTVTSFLPHGCVRNTSKSKPKQKRSLGSKEPRSKITPPPGLPPPTGISDSKPVDLEAVCMQVEEQDELLDRQLRYRTAVTL